MAKREVFLLDIKFKDGREHRNIAFTPEEVEIQTSELTMRMDIESVAVAGTRVVEESEAWKLKK